MHENTDQNTFVLSRVPLQKNAEDRMCSPMRCRAVLLRIHSNLRFCLCFGLGEGTVERKSGKGSGKIFCRLRFMEFPLFFGLPRLN